MSALLSTQKSCKLAEDPHELAGNLVCDQVCDLDSVMEFGLNSAETFTVAWLESSSAICLSQVTQCMRMINIDFASSTTHAKCKEVSSTI